MMATLFLLRCMCRFFVCQLSLHQQLNVALGPGLLRVSVRARSSHRIPRCENLLRVNDALLHHPKILIHRDDNLLHFIQLDDAAAALVIVVVPTGQPSLFRPRRLCTEGLQMSLIALFLGLFPFPPLFLRRVLLPHELDEPAFLRLVHLADPLPAEPLDKVSQGQPLGGVHVDVLSVADEVIVHVVGLDPRERVRPLEVLQEGLEELRTVIFDDLARVLAEYLHLSDVRLAGQVALEAVFVPTLLVAQLAVEFELLKALGLDSVRDRLWRREVVLCHRGTVAISLNVFKLPTLRRNTPPSRALTSEGF
mmetsp:Transcript_8742/g.23765  ORF Transcript_8742/g.23765 Transcript_8742/m.23765 type:complete len:308 (-) Transcript_8742:8-931(-)